MKKKNIIILSAVIGLILVFIFVSKPLYFAGDDLCYTKVDAQAVVTKFSVGQPAGYCAVYDTKSASLNPLGKTTCNLASDIQSGTTYIAWCGITGASTTVVPSCSSNSQCKENEQCLGSNLAKACVVVTCPQGYVMNNHICSPNDCRTFGCSSGQSCQTSGNLYVCKTVLVDITPTPDVITPPVTPDCTTTNTCVVEPTPAPSVMKSNTIYYIIAGVILIFGVMIAGRRNKWW